MCIKYQGDLFQNICLIYCTIYVIVNVNIHQVNLIANSGRDKIISLMAYNFI